MIGNKILLDTNIILYLFEGDKTVYNFLKDKELYCSVITELEITSYKEYTSIERKKAIEFFSICNVENINNSIKEFVIEVRKKAKIKLPDAIILATAMHLELPLFTADKGLKGVSGVDIILFEK